MVATKIARDRHGHKGGASADLNSRRQLPLSSLGLALLAVLQIGKFPLEFPGALTQKQRIKKGR
jgi:hypothetical protein